MSLQGRIEFKDTDELSAFKRSTAFTRVGPGQQRPDLRTCPSCLKVEA